jgi:two-component system sensor histidine kinase/response regulator
VGDDHAINQQLIILLLERLGYGSEVGSNGGEADQAVTTGSYALVLMDCQMPELDGFEATRLIREAENMKSQKIGVRGEAPETDLSETSNSLLLTPHHSRAPIVALTANARRQRKVLSGRDGRESL